MTQLTRRTAGERTLRRRIREGLEDWAGLALANTGQAVAPHHAAMIAALEDVASGATERLMLLMPPGYAKSFYATRLFPAWWLARHPRSAVITACNTAKLAEYFGRDVRRLLTAHGTRLNVCLGRDARAAGQFRTDSGGEYFAIGVGGTVTGRRADLAVIDDPVRGHEDADSRVARDRLWDWYRSELLTRLKPHGRVVLVMTRWHCDDLAGRLLVQEGWRCLRLPALAEADDVLGRAVGDALWPGWESRVALLAKQASMGDATFAALYQQAPLPEGGNLFDMTKIGLVDSVPDGVAVRAWDLASGHVSARDPDWTVGLKLVRDRHGVFCVDDVRRMRVAPNELAAAIVTTARQDGHAVTIGLPCDPGQAGSFQVTMLTRALAGYAVRSSPEVGSKARRAQFVAAQMAVGNVVVRRAAWTAAFLDELALFPTGPKDDQVDALSRAFKLLTEAGTPARFASVPHLAR